MGNTVQTVTGKVSTDSLGSVLMHEHVFASSMGVSGHYPQFYNPKAMEIMVKDLTDCKEEGILTVVDASPACLGRDVKLLKEASEKSGVNIIATSGWWGRVEPPYLGPTTVEQWTRCFIDDVTKGCDCTDIKAGILKAAMDTDGNTEWRKKIHYAVGQASLETGVKIMLHTYCPTETPRDQIALLKEVGVDMNNVIVDHIPETTDIDFVKWIYDQGVWLGISRVPIILFPGEHCVATDTRIKFIKTMLDEGMGDRMLFSHDVHSVSTIIDLQTEEIQKYCKDQFPERFLFIKKRVFPKLEEMGVDGEYLWNLTIDNPRRFFEG